MYSLFEHEYLGYLFESYVVQRNAKGQLTLQHQNISAMNAAEFADGLDANDFELIALTDQIQQDAVIKEFWPKKTTPADFFLKIYDPEKGDKGLQERICQYVQQRMGQLLDGLHGKHVFIMGKDGEPTWKEISVAPEPASVLFHFRRNPENTHYFPTIQYRGQRLDFQQRDAVMVCCQPAWMLLDGVLHNFRNEVDGKKLQPFLNKKFIVIPRQVEDSYYQRFVAPLVESFDVHARGFDIRSERYQAKPHLIFSDVPGHGGTMYDTDPNAEQIHFDIAFQYGDHIVRNHDKRVSVKLEKTSDSYVFHRLIRDLENEQNFIRELQDRALEVRNGRAVLEKATAFKWLHSHAEELARLGFTVQQGSTSGKDYFIGTVTVNVGITENNDWFDIHGTVRFGEFEIPFVKLRPYILQKRHEFKLPNGQIAIIPEEWFTQYLELFAFSEEHHHSLTLKKHHVALVSDLENGNLATVTMSRKLERLRGFEAVEDRPLPAGFNGALRPYQQAGYNWLHFVQEYHFGGCLADDMGLGKAQPLHARILTPTGWTTMGEVQIGDEVINAQGGRSRITGVFPQGEKEIFRVTFTDGATAECCAEHLWAVQSPVQKHRGQGFRVKELRELRHDLHDKHGNTKWFVPVVQPVAFAPRPVTIDPYFLGLLLGDGCFRQNSIALSSGDTEIVAYATEALPKGLRVRRNPGSYDYAFVKDTGWTNQLMQQVKHLGLKGKGSKDKFIPEDYLFNDVPTRVALLQGLMDTDGYVSASGDVCQFTTTSAQLAEGLTSLVQSLGGTAKRTSKTPTYRYAGELRTGMVAYTLTLSLPPDVMPFRLARKLALYRPKTKYLPYRGIKSVERVGSMPAQCIAVDAPDRLYVTDNFVVTHNTIQTLAMLLQRKESGAAGGAASLLVMPTSLVYNWLNEAQKFTPGLRVLTYTGTYRDKNVEQFADYDLILTSYGIVRLDAELLKTYKFDYVILDESQAIKNPSSTTSQAVRHLHSRHRLILTGTPVENSTMDLWSQMSFINPGLLGSQAFFRKEFLKPIEKEKDELKTRRLHTLIKPFILRRHKAQVATELPEKIEHLSYCRMTDEQQQCYEETKSYYRNKILQSIEEHGTASTQFMLLQGLTKLRQIANHPRMADETYEAESGKLREVVRMIRSVVAEGHKVLVFSQFVKHLELVRHVLDEKQIEYAYLDGNTRDRHKEVARFQKDEDLRVFLISLKAGGVGLNLTAADYVFILDPWWNPAVEAQAVDRAHRIGQERTVFTYKFITKGTVEEKILALQNRKIQLVSDLITTDEAIIKSLTKEDIEELLG
ncbi:SNF2-related protein [Hymenobacter latericus]|uniref:SNF2-related protein n=1 Tax=Hymenobacter sp. YIM 151858-1 TaxID=2987688 RepID=UPI00222616DE|nr:SNF2-related protein [Hymenobacter sp. YIM 151858-1]UYZ58339.1 SNF2-related protein [Hymenobacter sp. YIM 151858-1]